MRNEKLNIQKSYLFFALVIVSLFFAGCADIFKPETKKSSASGYGTVSLNLSGAARTVTPSVAFDSYKYIFSKDGAAGVEEFPDAGIFTLVVGEYTVTVEAYTGDVLMAKGVSEPFTVSSVTNSTINVYLAAATGGYGEFTYTITYPAGTVVEEITLQSVSVRRTVVIEMYDSYGDGWDGSGALRIMVNGVQLANNVRVSSTEGDNTPAGQRNTNTYSFDVIPGDEVQLYWVNSVTASENSYIVYYADDPPDPVFATTPQGTDSWSGTGALSYRVRNGWGGVSTGSLVDSFTYDPVVLAPQVETESITETLELETGSYLFTVLLNQDGKYTGISEAVHIYPETTTVYEKDFISIDFSPVTALAPYTWANGVIAGPTNEQWFSFTATAQNQYVHFELNDILLDDINVQLYDSVGDPVGNEANLNNLGDLYTTEILTPGEVYYVKVTPAAGGDGTYRIGITGASFRLPGEDEVPALSLNTWGNGSIAGASGVQWFTFTATDTTNYIHFDPGALYQANVQLYTPDETPVEAQVTMNSTTSFISRTLDPDQEYFIKVTQSTGTGAYRIAFTGADFMLPGEVPELTLNEWADGSIATTGGVQWFTFTATEDTQYIHFERGALVSAYVQLYNSSGVSIGTQVTMSGNTTFFSQTLTPDDVYYIKVRQYNGTGAYRITFAESFILPGAEAPALTFNTWANGTIATTGGVQWFKFTATEATQYIHFDPGALFQAYVQLYTSTGTTTGVTTTMSSSITNVTRALTADTEYYIKVTQYSGTGAYRIRFAASFEPLEVTTLTTVNAWGNGSIATSGGVQWFKFTATAETQYIHFDPGAISQAYVQLYTSTGTTVGIDSTMNNGVTYISRTLTAGEVYYIRVRQYVGTGAYRIGFAESFIPPGSVPQLTLNTWANGTIATTGGVQWFRFTATAETQYIHFDPGAMFQASVQLYDSTGMTVGSNTALSGTTTYTTRTLTDGDVYYIRVQQASTGTGAYRIGFAESFEPFEVTTLTTLARWVNGTIANANGVQWFKFEATAATQYIHFTPGDLTSAVVQLYDSTGATVGGSNTLSSATYISRTLTDGEVYYIKVRQYAGTGAYRIGFSPTTIMLPDNANSTLLSTPATWVNGEIAASGGIQWFRFTATAETQYIHFEPGALASAYVQLYDSTGVTAGGQTTMSSSTNSISRTLEPGNVYYIRVQYYNTTGAYRIAFATTSVILPDNAHSTELTTPDTWVDGNLTAGGVQWFRFTATAETQYIHFEPGTLYQAYVQLYDSTSIAAGGQTTMSSSTNSISRTLEPGNVYYIRVQYYNTTGAYRITFAATSVILPDNAHSTELTTPDTWVDGNLTAGGVQWFRFTATAATQYIHLEWGTMSDVYVQLYDSTGTPVGADTNLWSSTVYISRGSLTIDQEYYIRIRPYSGGASGTYRLAFNTSTARPTN